MSSAEILPFRGRKPKPLPAIAEQQDHPLPWSTEKGFIWDANQRLVGSALKPEMAEWVVRVVNSSADPA